MKIKDQLLKLKLNFIRKNAPEQFTHWNEDKNIMTFYNCAGQSVTIKKPLWLRCIEFIAYKR